MAPETKICIGKAV